MCVCVWILVLQYGYHLPESEENIYYCQVYFKFIGNILFTYPLKVLQNLKQKLDFGFYLLCSTGFRSSKGARWEMERENRGRHRVREVEIEGGREWHLYTTELFTFSCAQRNLVVLLKQVLGPKSQVSHLMDWSDGLLYPKSPPLVLSLLQPTTLIEICNLILPSPDMQYALDLIFDPFSYPWSISFTEGCLPSSFAHITVYSVFKKPSLSSDDWSNFCPISVLNFFSKS